uniref:Putative apolipoprotein d/lipocalin n=1 Tax=Xenopsylla cheopis TaxID=163159 RepID=A0A6M2DYQ3_XENCH
MVKNIVLILLFISINNNCHARTVPIYKCPEVTPMPNFDVNRHLGIWYEQYRYPNHFEQDGICVMEDLVAQDGGKIEFKHSMIKNGENITYLGQIKPYDVSSNDGHFLINYNVIGKRWHDYIILHSDYERFAIVWSCTVAPQGPIEFAWVLTRNKNTPKDLEDMLPMYLKQGPIDIDKLIKTDQDCEPDSSGSEEFNEDQSYDCEPNQVILEFIRLILRFFN